MEAGPQAPQQLLDLYYARVLGVAYQVVGDAALAARAAEAIFDQLQQETPVDVIDVWQVAADVLYSFIRRRLVVTPLASDASGWQAPLIDGLAQVDPEARMLLLLRYHERLDHEQLAAALRLNRQTVRAEVARARGELMSVLGGQGALR